MWYIVLGSIAAASAVAAICVYAKSRRTLTEADKMIDAAISGNFVESNFSEDELSRLGSKLYRYLSKGETSLAQINEEKDRIKTLISDISHQTKTPIANIMLYTQLLEEKSDEETREMIGRIAEQSEKLSFLIASLVKLSRLENGIVQVHPAQSSVRDLTRETFREFEAKANAKGVRIFLEEESEDGEEKTAVFDRKWTQEALANIVDNAIKYTAKGGKVSITSKEYELFARIDVSDTWNRNRRGRARHRFSGDSIARRMRPTRKAQASGFTLHAKSSPKRAAISKSARGRAKEAVFRFFCREISRMILPENLSKLKELR